MTLYVDHNEIASTKAQVTAYMNYNDTIMQKTNRVLNNLEQSVKINGSPISNSKEMVTKSMTTFKSNNRKCINVLNHVVEMYFSAIDKSISVMEDARSKM